MDNLCLDKTSYKFKDETLCAFNNKMHVGRFLCGFPKISSGVTHDILLSKLNF
jgi:hypothetical protein